MNMIGNPTHTETFAFVVPHNRRKISIELRTNSLIQNRRTIFSTEHNMHKKEAQRSCHGENYRSDLRPSTIARNRSWGFSPRWHSVALPALMLVLLLGCTTPKPTTQSPTLSTTHYTSRPTTPPPPFKLFHQSPDTLTLTTTESASNTQIAALIYQLRDAANTHTFGSIHLPQNLIDARNPIIWFHIYRGPKCASEKYAAKLPCGPSYHAAGEFTLGSLHDPNRTDGAIDIDENHQTELWNPDPK